MNIGKAIKELRKAAGYSQSDLCKNICSQAQLSKIENKNEIPSSMVLYKISRRLGVDMNYFFEFMETPRLDYLREVKSLIEECKRERNYQKLRDIIRNEKNNPLFQSKENQQFLLWHEAICFHYLDKDSDRAIILLNDALSLTVNKYKKYHSEIEIEILNSIAIIKKDQKLLDEAEELFKECLQDLKFIPRYDNIIKIRVLYGLSKLLTDKGEYKQSIDLCLEGIELCKKSEVLYLFGELQYQLGSNYARLKEVEKAQIVFEKSISIFEAQDNKIFAEEVRKLRKELLNG